MTVQESYLAKLDSMAAIFKRWKGLNKTAVIQFNYPKHVCLAALIGAAIEHHFVTANAGGIELLKEFGMGTPDEPSVIMVRATLDCL